MTARTLFVLAQWARELLSMPRIDRPLIADYARVSKASAIGFKIRPYLLNGPSSHTGATGIDTSQLKKVLQRCNVRSELHLSISLPPPCSNRGMNTLTCIR